MSDDGKVEIVITGTVDDSVTASIADARTAIETLAAAVGGIGEQGDASLERLWAALTAISGGAVSAEAPLSAVAAEAAQIGEEGSAGTAAFSGALEKVSTAAEAAEGATSKLHLAAAGAIKSYIDLGQQALSGGFSRLPETLLSVATGTGALDAATETLGAAFGPVGIAVAIVGGALIRMAENEYEAEKNAESLTQAFALTGRASEMSAAGVKYQLDFLSQLPGASQEAATSFSQYVAAHASIDPILANETGQLLPRFVDMLGKQGPEAAGKLAETLGNLTEDGFKKLDREMLNLSPAEYDLIENLIQSGREAEAVNRIMADLSRQSGIYIETLGDQAHDILAEIAGVKKELAGGGLDKNEILAGVSLLHDLQDRLRDVQDLAKQPGRQTADNQFKAGLDAAKQVTQELSKQETLVEQRDKFLKDASKATTPALKTTFLAAAAADQTKLTELKQQQNEKQYQNYVAMLDSESAVSRRGAADRIANDAKEVAMAKQLFGDKSQQYYDAVAKMNAAERTAAGARERIGKQEAETDRKILADRAREADASIQSILDSYGRYAEQYARDAEATAQAQTKAGDEAAQSSQKTLEQREKYGQIAADAEIQQAQAVEIVRYTLDMEALRRAQQVANIDKGLSAQLAREIESEETQHQKNMDEINQRGLDERMQQWEIFDSAVNSLEGSLAGDIFNRDRSLLQIGKQFLQELLTGYLQYYTKRKLLELESAAEQGAIWAGEGAQVVTVTAQKIATTIGGEAAQTGAVAAGVATRTAAQIAGAEEGKAVEAASNSTSIVGSAYKAAAGAYSALAGIPLIGPILGAAAAAMTFAAVMAFDVVSAEGGAERIGADGQFGILHKNESVLPARIAVPLLDLVSNSAAMANIGAAAQAGAIRVPGALLDEIRFAQSGSAPSDGAALAAGSAGRTAPLGLSGPLTSGAGIAGRTDAPEGLFGAVLDDIAQTIRNPARNAPSSTPAASGSRGGDTYVIQALDTSDFRAFLSKSSNRRAMADIARDRNRAGERL